MLSGLGAAASDTIYGAIAAFSISFVIQFLLRELHWIRLIGGSLLIAIGIIYYRKKPHPLPTEEDRSPAHSEFITAFLLNLTNPTVVLSFLALLAAMRAETKAWWLNLFLVSGILAGSLVWWSLLVLITNRYRSRFNERAVLWMNRIAGLAIGSFGIATLILSRAK